MDPDLDDPMAMASPIGHVNGYDSGRKPGGLSKWNGQGGMVNLTMDDDDVVDPIGVSIEKPGYEDHRYESPPHRHPSPVPPKSTNIYKPHHGTLPNSLPAQPTGYNQMPTELKWEWQHGKVRLDRNPSCGFGLAVIGGIDDPATNGDVSIIVKDILPDGPADVRLKKNDRLIKVNGISMENVEHAVAVGALRSAGSSVIIEYRRRIQVQVPMKAQTLPSYSQRNEDKRGGRERSDPYDQSNRSDDRYDQLNRPDPYEQRNRPDPYDQRNRPEPYDQHNRPDPYEQRNRPDRHDDYDRPEGSFRPSVPGRRAGGSQLSLTSSLDRNGAQTQFLTLSKTQQEGFGLQLGWKLFVQGMSEYGVAANQGLQKGDTIVKINNYPIEKLSLADAKRLIQTSGNSLDLEIIREPAAPKYAYSTPVLHHSRSGELRDHDRMSVGRGDEQHALQSSYLPSQPNPPQQYHPRQEVEDQIFDDDPLSSGPPPRPPLPSADRPRENFTMRPPRPPSPGRREFIGQPTAL